MSRFIWAEVHITGQELGHSSFNSDYHIQNTAEGGQYKKSQKRSHKKATIAISEIWRQGEAAQEQTFSGTWDVNNVV